MNYLVFRLYGPMASWGEIAVGGDRHSARYPGKSAIIGLLGAALGIKREEAAHHQSLIDGYTMAVKMLSAGQLLTDYHTTQAPKKEKKGFHFQTRRDEIIFGKKPLGTILSNREYRTGAEAIVAMRAESLSVWSLEQLQQALLKPKFHLYLGRKSCPLAAPLQPEIIEAEGFFHALQVYQPKPLLIDQPNWVDQNRFLPPGKDCHYYWQGDLTAFTGAGQDVPMSEVQQRVRHDQPLSRTRWQFQARLENFWLQRAQSSTEKEEE